MKMWQVLVYRFPVTVQNISKMKNQTMQTRLQQDEFSFWNGRNAHQPQTEAANAAIAHAMRVSVACWAERPELSQKNLKKQGFTNGAK